MWTVIGIFFAFSLFVAIMAAREEATKKRTRAEKIDGALKKVTGAFESLEQTIVAVEKEHADVVTASPRRLTELQVNMLFLMKRYGCISLTAAPSNAHPDAITVVDPGEMRTLRSLVRRGLAQDVGGGFYRPTPAGDLALFNVSGKN